MPHGPKPRSVVGATSHVRPFHHLKSNMRFLRSDGHSSVCPGLGLQCDRDAVIVISAKDPARGRIDSSRFRCSRRICLRNNAPLQMPFVKQRTWRPAPFRDDRLSTQDCSYVHVSWYDTKANGLLLAVVFDLLLITELAHPGTAGQAEFFCSKLDPALRNVPAGRQVEVL